MKLGCGLQEDRTRVSSEKRTAERDERCVDYKVALIETATLKKEDLEFGRQQVNNMLAGRPGMATLVKPGDMIYEWTAKRFGGRSCGVRIAWSGGSPHGGFPAENAYPTSERSGEIRIDPVHADGSKVSPQELWCYAVFELFNIANGTAWLKLEELALNDKIERTPFVEESARLEWCASQKTRDFYELLWVPFAAENHFEPGETFWRRVQYGSFREWKKSWGEIRLSQLSARSFL